MFFYAVAGGLLWEDFRRLKAFEAPVTPWAMQRLLEYIKLHYGNPTVVIHENGYMELSDSSTPSNARDDTERSEYLQAYIESLLLSIRNGANARAYFIWSFMDCFEFITGYTTRYGLYGVDFHDKDRKRYPRLSAHWYSSFLEKTGLDTRKSSYLYSS
ncbi:beta-glucosidase 3-like [Tasmannia lanceolata]|uniref:beta-glucosidase 3-like n=1 Tax=Tasmannia lanceolata TaxID=3420 RepID=UPI0040631FD1